MTRMMPYEQFVTEIQEDQYSTQPERLSREEAEIVAKMLLARVASDFDRFELWGYLQGAREILAKDKGK